MSMTASFDPTIRFSPLDTIVTSLASVPRAARLVALAGLIFAAGYQVSVALQSPAQLIRGQLQAAAAEAAALPWNRSHDQVRAAIAPYFDGRAVSVDPTKFPAVVTVTLRDVDHDTCQEARTIARRIEGSVVIALDPATPCSDSNAMVWRIMP
jgi:hypothetical protein